MIVSVTAQKGGVGKTTLSTNLICGLTRKGYKVLAIDLDPQRNLTQTITRDKFNINSTVLGVLTGEVNINDAIYKTKDCDLIPSHKMLYNVDAVINPIGKEKKLKKVLKPIKNKYDCIIIDTPPNLSTLTLNALTCCDYILMPIQADYFSLQAITDFYTDTFIAVKEELNPGIKILGYVFAIYSANTNLAKELTDKANELANATNGKLFDTTIRFSTVARESTTNAINLFDYAPKANVTQDYINLVDEFISLIN